MTKELLGINDIRAIYGLGRETSYRVLHAAPRVRLGKRVLARKAAIDALLERAEQEGTDLRDLSPLD